MLQKFFGASRQDYATSLTFLMDGLRDLCLIFIKSQRRDNDNKMTRILSENYGHFASGKQPRKYDGFLGGEEEKEKKEERRRKRKCGSINIRRRGEKKKKRKNNPASSKST